MNVETESISSLCWLGIVAAAVTGAIHLWLGIADFPGGFGIAFLFAAAGFAGGIVAVLVDYRRRLVYTLGVPFTAGQIVLWYLLNDVPPVPTLHAVDKLAQVVLVVVLIALLRRE